MSGRTIPYQNSFAFRRFDADSVFVGRYDGVNWIKLPGKYHPHNNRFVAESMDFGILGVFANPGNIPEIVSFTSSQMQVSGLEGGENNQEDLKFIASFGHPQTLDSVKILLSLQAKAPWNAGVLDQLFPAIGHAPLNTPVVEDQKAMSWACIKGVDKKN